MECYKESSEHRQMRKVAFIAVVVSTMAVVVSIVTLPMLYNYVQNFQSHMMAEAEFCKARSRDMWVEMWKLQAVQPSLRFKRGWLFASGSPRAAKAAAAPSTPVLDQLHPVPAHNTQERLQAVQAQAQLLQVAQDPTAAQWSTRFRTSASAAHAIKDRPGLLVPMARPARMARTAATVLPEKTARMEPRRNPSDQNPNPASSAHPDRQALLAPLDPKDPLARRALPPNAVKTESPADTAWLARKAPPVALDVQDQRAQSAHLEKSTTFLDQQDPQAHLDQLVQPEQRDHLEEMLARPMVCQVLVVMLVSLVKLATPDQLANVVHEDHLAPLAHAITALNPVCLLATRYHTSRLRYHHQ